MVHDDRAVKAYASVLYFYDPSFSPHILADIIPKRHTPAMAVFSSYVNWAKKWRTTWQQALHDWINNGVQELISQTPGEFQTWSVL